MREIKFIPLTYGSGTKTYVRADTIVRLTENKDNTTSVYTTNSDAPMFVNESISEILIKIGGYIHDS